MEGYEVEAFIAQGGHSLVYRAFDPGTRQVVAIKEYFPHAFALRHATQRVTARLPRDSPRFDHGRRAFLDEARLLERFDHPSLVRVLGLFEANGTAYRVMRFTPGPTLWAHRQALGRMPAVEDLRRWVDGLLGALATLHHAGCAHGAVRPANILLRPGERPLLLGFGAVRNTLGPEGPRQALTEDSAATSAPAERASPAAGASVAADLRALAATLRYCIEGRASASPSLADAWRREGGPVPIPQDMTRLLCAIDACLADEPRDRPQSVAEFLRMIRRTDKVEALHIIVSANAGRRDQVQEGRDAVDGVASAGALHRSPEPERTAANDPRTGQDTDEEPAPPSPDEGVAGQEGLAAASIEIDAEAASPDATVAESRPAAEPLAECGAGAVSETTVDARADSPAEAEAEVDVAAATEADAHREAEAKAEFEAEAKAEAEAEVGANTVAAAAVEVDVEVEPRLDAVLEAETDDQAAAMAVSDSANEPPQASEPLPEVVLVPPTREPSLAVPAAADSAMPLVDEIHASPGPTASRVESAPMPRTPEPSSADLVGDAIAMPRVDEIRVPALSGVDATAVAATAKHPVRLRRSAAATAIAASVLFAVVLTVWAYRQADSSRSAQVLPLPAGQVAAAPNQVAPASSSPEAAPAVAAAAPPSPLIDPQPTAFTPESGAAPSVVAGPARPPSVPAAKEPAAPHKIAAAAPRQAPPQQACDGRKGFALYRCVQLQCAKAAWANHGDCAALQ